MTLATTSVMSSRPQRPTRRLAIKGRFDLGTEHGMAAYRNVKGRRVSGLSIGYAIRNSTKTAAGNELTDLRHGQMPIMPVITLSPSIPCR